MNCRSCKEPILDRDSRAEFCMKCARERKAEADKTRLKKKYEFDKLFAASLLMGGD